jgi:hypothetical protein
MLVHLNDGHPKVVYMLHAYLDDSGTHADSPCRKRINTNSQYLRHLADDVLPQISDGVLSATTSDR